jgi:hypothetical protein
MVLRRVPRDGMLVLRRLRLAGPCRIESLVGGMTLCMMWKVRMEPTTMEKRNLLLLPLPPAPVNLPQRASPPSLVTHETDWISFSRVITLIPRKCFIMSTVQPTNNPSSAIENTIAQLEELSRAS